QKTLALPRSPARAALCGGDPRCDGGGGWSAAVGGEVLRSAVAHGPDVAGRGRRDAAKLAVDGRARRVGARDGRPGGAVPVLDEGLPGRAVVGVADRPGVARRGGGHAEEKVVMGRAGWAGAGDLLPGAAVPAFAQGLPGGAVVVAADSPGIAG